MTCKGICVRYKAQKPVGTGRYASGQRRCQICEIFIKWEGLWCPCCGYRLRTKPRNLKYKAKLRARVEADSIEAKAVADTQPEVEVDAVAAKAKTKSKAKTPKSKTPKSKTPKSKTPKSKTPKSKTPKSKTPKSKTPKSKTPKSKTPKSKTPKPKTITKTKEKTPCKHCEKLFVYPDKHEKNCKKNPNTEVDTSPKSESIAIKA